jgi:hypothetical protein
MCLSLVFQTEQSKELGRISESFYRVIADNKCLLYQHYFHRKGYVYLYTIAFGVGKYHFGSVAVELSSVLVGRLFTLGKLFNK